MKVSVGPSAMTMIKDGENVLANSKAFVTPDPTSNTVGIEWSPVAAGERLSFKGNTFKRVYEALYTTFGPFPITLEMRDHPLLNAMAHAAGEGFEPYSQLADAVARYSVVQLRTIE